ncbi:MAG: porin family protein [Gammaproteobacteria bacterium]|nr:porin family protein [Gammaproteobacteria bacterium]
MKKLALFFLLTFLVFPYPSVQARDIELGTIMIAGDTSFDDSTIKMDYDWIHEKTETTVFDVTAGYFFARNLAAGLLIANEDSRTSDGMSVVSTWINMFGPVIAYNISLNPDFSLMLTAGFFKVSGEMSAGAGMADYDGNGIYLMGSIAYFITDTIAVNVGLRKTDSDVDITASGINFSADLSELATAIGLSVFF